MFKFYEKPMVSDFVLHRWSALSWNTKKSSLSGEVARRLLNCSPEILDDEYEDEVLDKFRWKMMISGYPENEREIIIREGRSRYSNIIKLVDQRKRPWNKESRAIEKKVKMNSLNKEWYGLKDSVVFVPATPEEKGLKRLCLTISSM